MCETMKFFSEICDGNLKMTLGMIWTIILRFSIQDISVEGMILLSVSLLSPLLTRSRNVRQGGTLVVVSAQDPALQQCESQQLPPQVGYSAS